MKLKDGKLTLSATDLSSHFECERKVWLDLEVAAKNLQRSGQSEIERRMLERRGRAHEAKVLEYFKAQGKQVVSLGSNGSVDESGPQTTEATVQTMRDGAEVIYQGVLALDGWTGRPDFLIRVERKSNLGRFSYEPLDAKLARDEKARAVLQLCVYADLLRGIQGSLPEHFWLALGHDDVQPLKQRTLDFYAYYDRAKGKLGTFTSNPQRSEPYPEPCEHCDVCQWWLDCDKRRRTDDHLSLVAGITRRQRGKLVSANVTKLATLASLPEGQSVEGIDSEPLHKIRHQAQLQHSRSQTNQPVYDLLTDGDPGTGLAMLPPPTPGDLFLDLEGDAFVHDGGLEYLFGLVELGKPEFDFTVRKTPGDPNYLHFWATNRAEEKAAFEKVMDRIFEGLDEFPLLHVFHFGHRENNALKVLSCRHNTREDQVDQLLRKGVLVDLHTVVRQGLRASVEAYTLKEMERFYKFNRTIAKRDAAKAMQYFGWWLETGEEELPLTDLKKTLHDYNKDDCLSAWTLRDWLEERRGDLEAKTGRPLGRPEPKDDHPSPKAEERQREQEALTRRLLDGLPADPRDDNESDKAKRLLADLLGWHWRELKPGYWEYHQGADVPPSERLSDRLCLADISYEGIVRSIKNSHVYRYRFPDQEHAIRASGSVEEADSDKKKPHCVNVLHVGPDYVDVKRAKNRLNDHPASSLRPAKPIPSNNQEARLFQVALAIAEKGLHLP